MKSIRKYLKSISSLLAFLVLLVSCTQYDSSVDDDLAINQSNGEELFKGIFFGNGPIASKLSNYADYENLKSQFTSEQKTAFMSLQNSLIAHIKNESPEFFVNFKNSINTGNQIIIRNELKNSKEFLKNAIEEITNLKYDAIEKTILEQKTNLIVDLNNINNLKAQMELNGFNQKADAELSPIWVVVIAAAAAIVVVVVVFFDFWVTDPIDSLSQKSIENENFINSIAELNVN